MDSFKDLILVKERLNSFFDDPQSRARNMGGPIAQCAWSPAVDIYETDREFVLRAELSGINRDDITIEVKDNVLFLKGHRDFLHDIRAENCYRMERSYGMFQRNFNLPNNIVQDEVGAAFKDGVLEIRLPKEKAGDPDVIKVCVE